MRAFCVTRCFFDFLSLRTKNHDFLPPPRLLSPLQFLTVSVECTWMEEYEHVEEQNPLKNLFVRAMHLTP